MAAAADETPVVGGFKNVADGGADVPFTLHFSADSQEHHITSQQMCQMAVIDNAATLHATGVSITGGDNAMSSAATISVLQGHPEDAKPLPTVSRQFVVTGRGGGNGPLEQSAVVATHALLHPGTNTHVVRHEFASGLDCCGAPKYTHPDHLDDAGRQSLIKKSLLWQGHHGENADELKRNCIQAEKGGVKRYAVPIIPTDSEHAGGLIKLVGRNLGPKPEDAARLKAMFPTSAVEARHHVMMTNAQIGKPHEEVPHVILSAADADKAAKALEENLQHSAFSDGLTIRCNTLTGEPPDGDTFVHCVLHRQPVVHDGSDGTGKFLTKTDAGKLAGQVGVQGSVASTNDQIANLIFAPKLSDGANREAGEAAVVEEDAPVAGGGGDDE